MKNPAPMNSNENHSHTNLYGGFAANAGDALLFAGFSFKNDKKMPYGYWANSTLHEQAKATHLRGQPGNLHDKQKTRKGEHER